MSNYRLVSTLHAARATLADARKAGDTAAVEAAEDQVAAAAVAVDAALADGRVAFATHLLDLDLDSLGAILSHLGPGDALHVSHTCTKLRSALSCGGLPGPLAAVCFKQFRFYDTAADKETALHALDGMEPALRAQRLVFGLNAFDEGHARVLARALDAAPRAASIDIAPSLFGLFGEGDAGRLAEVLSSPDRAFTSPPQVHLQWCDLRAADTHNRYADSERFMDRVVANAADTLVQLHMFTSGPFNLPARFPALRRLDLDLHPEHFTTDMPSLTALAPQLKEIRFKVKVGGCAGCRGYVVHHGFGFDPGRFARFVAAIDGVTRVCFGPCLECSVLQNENENLRQLAVLRTLRDLEISCVWIRAQGAENAVINLPPLAPGLTRLAFSGATRVAFGHPLPGLRVLDWRGSFAGDRDRVHVPPTIPPAAIAPNLHTLLIAYSTRERGGFDLWTLVAAPTALRVVVIERARLSCSAPDGFKAMAAGFAAVLARKAKNLVSVHVHDCVYEDGHQPAAEHFLRALEQRGVRVCYAGVDECLFCMMHDGKDLWPPRDALADDWWCL